MRLFAPTLVASCLLITTLPVTAQNAAQPSHEPRLGTRPGAEAPGEDGRLMGRHQGLLSPRRRTRPDPGQCRATMIQDGKFLQSEFEFKQAEGKSTGLGIIGFEPETGRFTSFWVDSRQTRVSARQSREPFDGQKIVLYSVSLDPQTQGIPPLQDHFQPRGRRPQARPPPVQPGQRNRGTPDHGAHHDQETSIPPIGMNRASCPECKFRRVYFPGDGLLVMINA